MNENDPLKIWLPVRLAIGLATAVDVLVGLLFLIGPELRLLPWPSPISSTLARFIGAIILANGIGSAMIVWDGKWESARILFTVSLIYGLVVLLALPVDLFMYKKDAVLWGYVALDAIFLFPIGGVFLTYEFMRWRQRPAH